MSDIEQATINVGLADGDLRLCLATEAARQGEMRLALQLSNIQAAETRATSLLGWSVTGLSALAVLTVDPVHRALAIPSAVCLAVCAVACMTALWPKSWQGVGYTPGDLEAWNLQSELELKESLAAGYKTASDANLEAMRRFGMCVRVAWLTLTLAPLAGILEIFRLSS